MNKIYGVGHAKPDGEGEELEWGLTWDSAVHRLHYWLHCEEYAGHDFGLAEIEIPADVWGESDDQRETRITQYLAEHVDLLGTGPLEEPFVDCGVIMQPVAGGLWVEAPESVVQVYAQGISRVCVDSTEYRVEDGSRCNECQLWIPDIDTGGLANRYHAESCSLFESNLE